MGIAVVQYFAVKTEGMKHFILAAAGILIFSLCGSAQSADKGTIVKADEFSRFIDTIGLKFEMPPGYKETYVKENGDLWYSFAIKNTKADFEVRYTVWPLKQLMEDYKNCQADPNCVMVHPNVIYTGRIQANVLNMTGGIMYDISPFPKQAVKEEFNADDGGSSFFQFNCEFGKGYKYGQMVYLHKDNVADVIITYMSNDKSKHSDLMMIPFHSLTFK
jgi:hypothetical protein